MHPKPLKPTGFLQCLSCSQDGGASYRAHGGHGGAQWFRACGLCLLGAGFWASDVSF